MFVDDDDAARWPEYIMHVLMETAGAAGRELLQRPELANELVEVDADGNQVTEAADFFRALLAREVEFRAAGGAEAMAGGSEDSE